MIRNRWLCVMFLDDVLADTSVSVREEVPVLALHILTDKGVPLVTPVVDQDVRRIKDQLFSQDDRADEVSGLANMWSADSSWYFGCGIIVWGYRDGSGFYLPTLRGVRRTEPWWLDWTARAWIIGEEWSGTLVLWVNNACMCVVIAMFGPNGLSGLR